MPEDIVTNQLIEVWPVNELHGEVENAGVIFSYVVDGGNVWVGKSTWSLRFLKKTTPKLRLHLLWHFV